MYITAVPNRNSPPAILLRESFRDGDKVRTRTLANLTSWAPERIDALRRALKGEFDGFTGEPQPVCGPIFAVLFALKQLADRVGLLQVLGSERWAKLVLFLILARVAAQGSRLSAVRWATQHAVAETLGLKPFDEDDLYEALDRLAEEQEDIEDALYRRIVRQRGGTPTVVLYDVTSSYLEGEQNELAAFGYNRDKKPGKAQIVIGLLTTVEGEPLAVHVYEGNTSDPVTVPEQVPHAADPVWDHRAGLCRRPRYGEGQRQARADHRGVPLHHRTDHPPGAPAPPDAGAPHGVVYHASP